jgi:hypothetical protein
VDLHVPSMSLTVMVYCSAVHNLIDLGVDFIMFGLIAVVVVRTGKKSKVGPFRNYVSSGVLTHCRRWMFNVPKASSFKIK